MGYLLLDLDGTLIDSLADLGTAMNRLLAEQGRRPVSRAEMSRMVGDGATMLTRRAFALTAPAAATTPPPAELDRLTARFLEHYDATGSARTRLYPGVATTLARLRRRGWRLGLATNKPQAPSEAILARFGLERLFDAVIGGDTAPAHKPDPTHLTATLAALGAPHGARAVMVGDGPHDVDAARAAGLPVILVTFGFGAVAPQTLGADGLIERFDQLPETLEKVFTLHA